MDDSIIYDNYMSDILFDDIKSNFLETQYLNVLIETNLRTIFCFEYNPKKYGKIMLSVPKYHLKEIIFGTEIASISYFDPLFKAKGYPPSLGDTILSGKVRFMCQDGDYICFELLTRVSSISGMLHNVQKKYMYIYKGYIISMNNFDKNMIKESIFLDKRNEIIKPKKIEIDNLVIINNELYMPIVKNLFTNKVIVGVKFDTTKKTLDFEKIFDYRK